MDAPKKRRFRFGLRTLLGVVALVGMGLYFRPGQVNPGDVPIGATKAWVYWNCGPPKYIPDDLVWVEFRSFFWGCQIRVRTRERGTQVGRHSLDGREPVQVAGDEGETPL